MRQLACCSRAPFMPSGYRTLRPYSCTLFLTVALWCSCHLGCGLAAFGCGDDSSECTTLGQLCKLSQFIGVARLKNLDPFQVTDPVIPGYKQRFLLTPLENLLGELKAAPTEIRLDNGEAYPFEDGTYLVFVSYANVDLATVPDWDLWTSLRQFEFSLNSLDLADARVPRFAGMSRGLIRLDDKSRPEYVRVTRSYIEQLRGRSRDRGKYLSMLEKNVASEYQRISLDAGYDIANLLYDIEPDEIGRMVKERKWPYVARFVAWHRCNPGKLGPESGFGGPEHDYVPVEGELNWVSNTLRNGRDEEKERAFWTVLSTVDKHWLVSHFSKWGDVTISLLDDGCIDVREDAAILLTRVGHPRGIESLITKFPHHDRRVSLACKALKESGLRGLPTGLPYDKDLTKERVQITREQMKELEAWWGIHKNDPELKRWENQPPPQAP